MRANHSGRPVPADKLLSKQDFLLKFGTLVVNNPRILRVRDKLNERKRDIGAVTMKIVSLDDHPIFGHGLQEALVANNPDFQVTSLSKIQNTLTYLKDTPDVDILILDLTMPEMDGIMFMHAMEARSIVVPVVIMSAQSDMSLFQEALNTGAMGILPKTSSLEEIENTLRRVYEGEVLVPDSIANSLKTISKHAHDNTESILSKRQLEILKMVQAGLSNQGIACVLFISELTVKSHLQSIFKILGAKNRIDCVRKAENLAILLPKSQWRQR